MGIEDVSHGIVGVAVVLVALWAFRKWTTHRGAARGWFFLTIATLAEVVLVDQLLIDDTLTDVARVALTMEFVILAFFPYSLFRFAACFKKPSRTAELSAGGALTTVVMLTAWVPAEYFTSGYPTPEWFPFYLVGFFAYWIMLSIIVAWRLWIGGSGQPSVIRRRMRTLSFGALGTVSALAAGIVISDVQSLDLLLSLVQLISVMLLALGYDPPASVRRAWRQQSELQLRQAAINLITAKSETEAGRILLPRALSIVGGSSAAWYDNDGVKLVYAGEEAPDSLAALEPIKRSVLKAGDVAMGEQRIEMKLRRGKMVLWVNDYTPFFGQEEVDLVKNVGVLFDLAGEREARVSESNRRWEAETMARILADSVIPQDLPNIPGVAIGARYEPAHKTAAVGGDWYDAFEIAPHTVMLALGDVMGKGSQAAAVMAQLRNALRAYVLDGARPAEALAKINRLCIRSHPDTMATVWVGLWDLESGSICASSAGHLPPIIADSAARLVSEHQSGVPIGVLENPGYEEYSFQMPLFSQLMIYSDGLVERRGESLEEGFARATTWWEWKPVEEVAAHMVDAAHADGAGEDDIALLVASAVPVDELQMRIPADPAELGRVRAIVRRWLLNQHARTGSTLDEQQLEWRVVFSSGEALANAVEHAYGPAGGDVDIHGWREGSMIYLEIRDYGTWRPRRERNRGRGTPLMDEMTDHFEVTRYGNETSGTAAEERSYAAEAGRSGGTSVILGYEMDEREVTA